MEGKGFADIKTHPPLEISGGWVISAINVWTLPA